MSAEQRDNMIARSQQKAKDSASATSIDEKDAYSLFRELVLEYPGTF